MTIEILKFRNLTNYPVGAGLPSKMHPSLFTLARCSEKNLPLVSTTALLCGLPCNRPAYGEPPDDLIVDGCGAPQLSATGHGEIESAGKSLYAG